MRVLRGTSALILAGALTAGCGGSDHASKADGSNGAAGSGQAITTASPAPASTFSSALVGQGNVFFMSPSGNIGCALSETGARCDIRDRSWTPPPRPATCDVNFGLGATVVATS